MLRRLIVVLAGLAVVCVVAASAGFSASTVVVKRTLTVSVTGSGRLVSSPRGFNCSATCSLRFRRGAVVRVIPVPSTGWQFSGWSGACRGTGACAVKLTVSRVVLATFTLVPVQGSADNGNFAGNTADHESWAFTIGNHGFSLTNLKTGQMNESCNPPLYLDGGDLSFAGPIAVSRGGSFSINTSLTGTVGSSAAIDKIAITGQISGGVASGTYRMDTSFSSQGIGYSCTTGNQTWSAALTP